MKGMGNFGKIKTVWDNGSFDIGINRLFTGDESIGK